MRRIMTFVYGLACYAIFLGTFLYAIGFVGNFIVPKSMDSATERGRAADILINLVLLALFAVQHSGMARPGFKRLWTRIVPEPAERSTYVLFSSVALILLFSLWRPIGGTVWNVEGVLGRTISYTIFTFGWLLVLVSTFLINHFDLFGLRQVWLSLRGIPYTPLRFTTPGPYQLVRHPLYIGWFLAFWSTPTMTVTHLVFAVITTAYIIVATLLEERDLVASLPEYDDYRVRVPRYVPRLVTRNRRKPAVVAESKA